MSDSRSAATSPARNPSRDSKVRIAKSRRPTRVRRSQLANSRATDLASSALTNPASRQPATDGTASASVVLDLALHVQEPQQRPQPGDHALRRADAATPRLAPARTR